MIDAVRAGARGEHLQGVGATLQLSAPLMLDPAPELLTCSGGVAEFIYGREKRGFGDLGAALGRQLVDAVTTGAIPLPLANLDRGIRATVTGLSQFSTQLSGSTMACSNESVLPLRDVPVAGPGIVIDDDVTPAQIAELIRRNVRASGTDTTGAVALPLEWATRPTYDRLRTAADGIVEGIGHEAAQTPLVVILDTDLAASLGAILTSEHRLGRPVVSLDSVEVGEGDFIDIGCRTVPGGLVPIVSKTLLFPEAAGSIRRDTD
jgi:ethanolamine utilization protein EutA